MSARLDTWLGEQERMRRSKLIERENVLSLIERVSLYTPSRNPGAFWFAIPVFARAEERAELAILIWDCAGMSWSERVKSLRKWVVIVLKLSDPYVASSSRNRLRIEGVNGPCEFNKYDKVLSK